MRFLHGEQRIIKADHVTSYSLISSSSTKKTTNVVKRGLIGGLLLGPLGALGGILTSSNKGIYVVQIVFNDGKSSIVEMSDQEYFSFIQRFSTKSPSTHKSEIAKPSDNLYDKALDVVNKTGKCSISFIQRELRIGYNQASELVERMEKEGYVSAPDSIGRREVL